MKNLLLGWAAGMLGRGSNYRPQKNSATPRILVIRRNRLGDMLCTVPMLHALRRHFPAAHLAVACDIPGAPVAEALEAVDETIVLEPRGLGLFATLRNARRLQGFDWVIATKGGFDRRLATLARLTNGAVRIGFEPPTAAASSYYTDAVPPPADLVEHQIETLHRLLAPLGVSEPAQLPQDLALDLPPAARAFARDTLALPPFAGARHFLLINLSSTVPLRFGADDFLELARRYLAAGGQAVGLVAAPADQPHARKLAARVGSKRVVAVATPGPLELAALLESAALLVTPEGGAAHLAAAMGTSAVVFWSEGPFEKWRSRAANHVFLRPEKGESSLPLDRVWAALQSLVEDSEILRQTGR
jgi:heptosyltransferase-3